MVARRPLALIAGLLREIPTGDSIATDISAVPTAHAVSHGLGGTDPVTAASIGAVPTARLVSAGPGLSGGGALSADRTVRAHPSLLPELWTDWTTKPDGAIPATGDEGLPITVAIGAVGTALPVVSGGGVLFPGTGAIYLLQTTTNSRKIRRIGATFKLTSASVGAETFAMCAFVNTLISPQQASLHVIVTSTSWAIQCYDGTVVSMNVGNFATALAQEVEYRMEIILINDTLYATFPDGTVAQGTNAKVASISGIAATWEIVQGTAANALKILRTWADDLPDRVIGASEPRIGQIARRAIPTIFFDDVTQNIGIKTAAAPWADLFVAGVTASYDHILANSPSNPSHAARKDYTDAADAARVTLATVTTKGDLIVGTANAAVARQAAGADGLALVTDSTLTTGVKWAAPTPAAHAGRHGPGGSDDLSGYFLARAMLTAKGDIIAAQSSSVINRLAVGTDGQVLTADSVQGAGLRWAFPGLVPTTVKTAAYTAQPGELVLVDASAGPITITLPAVGAATVRTGVKKTDATANVVTVAAGAGQSIGVQSSTTLPGGLQTQFQIAEFRAVASATNYAVVAGQLALASLDLRYVRRDAIYDAGTSAATTLTPDLTNGWIQQLVSSVAAAGTLTVAVPTGTVVDRSILRLAIKATNAITVTLNASYLLSTGITSRSFALTAGQTLELGLEYGVRFGTAGSLWAIVSCPIINAS